MLRAQQILKIVSLGTVIAVLDVGAASAADAPSRLSGRGTAQICDVSGVSGTYSLNVGRATAMTVSNDGVCAFALYRIEGFGDLPSARRSYDSAATVRAPSKGSVSFRADGTYTWVEYKPQAGVIGNDTFAFSLLPGVGYFPVTVNVVAREPVAEPAPPEPWSSFVYFDLDKAALGPAAIAVLDRVGVALANPVYRDYRVHIAGHADASGTSAHNLVLSKKRAEAVRSYLMAHYAIAADRVRFEGFGDSDPLDPGNPRGDVNRRVHLTIVRGLRAMVGVTP